MAFTAQQLASLEAAYAQGALRVRYGDRDVTFHSRKEMRELLDEMRAELGSGPKSGMKIMLTTFDKGTR